MRISLLPRGPLSLRRLLAAVGIVLIILAVFWFVAGRALTETYLQQLTQDWVSFQVPENAVELRNVSVTRRAGSISVCNQRGELLSGLLIRLNDIYVAELNELHANKCSDIPLDKFASYTWKQIPPGPNVQVKTVEILATVHQPAYFRRGEPGSTTPQ